MGPLLAGTLAVTFGKPASTSNADLSQVAVFVLAGFSPRYVVSVIEAVARRSLPNPATGSVAARAVPLNQVRGISDDIADRLAEEGITNVTSLARANPVRLLRNTKFDRQQILVWIDCALLMDSLPEQWMSLERAGIRTATSLRWYSTGSDAKRAEQLTKLAAAAGVNATVLALASDQLVRDSQALTLLVLGQDDEDGSSSGATETHGTLGSTQDSCREEPVG